MRSKDWFRRHVKDSFVNKAKSDGYRSRSAYKLIEIFEKFNLAEKCNGLVVDLGASPGGWSQVLKRVGNAQDVIAVDLLDMKRINDVRFIRTDFRLLPELADLKNCFMIISDISPNVTGIVDVDRTNIFSVTTDVLDFACNFLIRDGCCVIKVFRTGDEAEILKSAKRHFRQVRFFKPSSSRQESPEIYLIALGKI